jgi:poly(A) polymerase
MLTRYSNDKNGRPVKTAVIYTKDEHCIDKNKIDPDAIRVIEQLRNFGFSAYLVGGAVRDLIIGNTPKDFDIVTNATPSKIKKLFRNSRIIGRRFRLVHIFFGAKIFEVSTFRSLAEGTVGNSFGTMDEDVRRRDFTLNALYYDPIKEQCIDYVGGVRDIRKRIIRPVIPLDNIFVEDPVRMLRAVKYAATTGFKLPYQLKHKICKSANLLSPVSPSRLTEELLKIVNSGHAYDIVQLALETDVYMYLQPAATALMYDKPGFEKSYLAHLKELDALHIANPDCRTGQKLVYLIYDFIEGLTDWQKESAASAAGELYTRTWSQCRNFVLPMNPKRTELEYAIRTVLKKLGISIRIPKDAFTKKRPSRRGEDSQKSEKNTENDSAVSEDMKAAVSM